MSGPGREMRLDPTTRTWILVGKPPEEPEGKQAPPVCPFCPGREVDTPPTIAAVPGADGAWRVRCFADRAPVFRIEGPLDRAGEGLYDRMR
ncbi:MAG: galactose-1-phosphate uridylyltransferase, partial [candidate division NC10 bacterium]|nr:galactose-1-phosphate uridylyltransferase [candidate division NC10 bacterium]